MRWFITTCKITVLFTLPVAVAGVFYITTYVIFIFPYQDSIKALIDAFIVDHPFLFYLLTFFYSLVVFLRLWIKVGEDSDRHPYEHVLCQMYPRWVIKRFFKEDTLLQLPGQFFSPIVLKPEDFINAPSLGGKRPDDPICLPPFPKPLVSVSAGAIPEVTCKKENTPPGDVF